MLKTHPLNVSSLVVGLIFLGLAGSWALRETGVIEYSDAAWLLPVLLVIAGAAGLVAAVVRNLRTSKRNNDYNNDNYDNTYGEL